MTIAQRLRQLEKRHTPDGEEILIQKIRAAVARRKESGPSTRRDRQQMIEGFKIASVDPIHSTEHRQLLGTLAQRLERCLN